MHNSVHYLFTNVPHFSSQFHIDFNPFIPPHFFLTSLFTRLFSLSFSTKLLGHSIHSLLRCARIIVILYTVQSVSKQASSDDSEEDERKKSKLMFVYANVQGKDKKKVFLSQYHCLFAETDDAIIFSIEFFFLDLILISLLFPSFVALNYIRH